MDVLYPRCAGLDVHKDTVVACLRIHSGGSIKREQKRFPTVTAGLLALSQWLEEGGATHVVMESTGIYWKPVWSVLEDGFQLTLAHARSVRNLPGRKSDTSDAAWLADLLAHGLIRGGFVPPLPIDQLRELTRTRRHLLQERVQHNHRIQKTLESANIRLPSILSEILGVSGMRIIHALIEGVTDPETLAKLADVRVRAGRKDLIEALRGRVTDHHRFLLRIYLDQVAGVEQAITLVEARIEEHLRPYQEQVERLTTIPGIGPSAAHVIVAEVGVDMSRFPSADHLVSWAGLCPRMDESAGKHRDTRIRDGNPWLKPVLVQAAWVAVRAKKGDAIKARFQRLRLRRGGKKAIVAIAAHLLRIAYHILKDGNIFKDFGKDYFQKEATEKTAKRLLKRLQALGVEVEIKNAA